MNMPVVSMMKKGLPPARSAISTACASDMWPLPAWRTRWIDSSAESGSNRRSTAFPLVDPQSALTARSSGRARAMINARRGPRRPGVARRSIRSSIGGFRSCASSNMIAGQSIHHSDEARLYVVHEGGLVGSFGEAEQEPQALRRSFRLRGVAASIHEFAQQTPNLLRRIAGIDARQVPDDGGHRREGGGVRVRTGLAAEDDHGGADARRQLVDQARFADAGLAYDRDEHRAAGRGRQAKALVEDRLLAGAADERDRAPGGTRREAFDRKRFERRIEAFGLDPAAPPVGDLRGRQGMCGGADEHLSWLRSRLQPCGSVYDRPRHEQLTARVAAHRGLTGLDSDPDLERLIQAGRLAQPARARADGETGADRPQCIVLVHGWQPEHRHHGVADELLRPAPERDQLLRRGREELSQHLS